jgi:EAL domain-containing protein (putative c-di-GMP-specific phosphodiesterase class I)
VAHFQPIIGACGNILAVEALARWYLADGNIVRPDKFIPIAERSKYIHELGLLMLEEVCEAINKLNRCGFDDVLVNLNMSAAQL